MPGCAHRPAEPEAPRRRANDPHSRGRPCQLAMVADHQDTPLYRETDVSTAEAGQNTAPCPPRSHAATAPIPEVRWIVRANRSAERRAMLRAVRTVAPDGHRRSSCCRSAGLGPASAATCLFAHGDATPGACHTRSARVQFSQPPPTNPERPAHLFGHRPLRSNAISQGCPARSSWCPIGLGPGPSCPGGGRSV